MHNLNREKKLRMRDMGALLTKKYLKGRVFIVAVSLIYV